MLQALLFSLPSLLIIFSLYLFFFRKSLQTLLKLTQSRLISLIALTFFLLAILGFILILNQQDLFTVIWLIVILVLIALLAFLTYLALNKL